MASSRSRSLSTTAADMRMCFCDVPARIYVSKKDRSKRKRFYGCRNYGECGRYCGYFEWVEVPSNVDEAMSAMSKPVEEVSLVMDKIAKLKQKLKILRKEALIKEMEVDRLKEGNSKLGMCCVLSWIVTSFVVLTWICMM